MPTLGVPTGAWRWAALGFGLLALAAAAVALIYPDKAGLAGYALLGGIGAVAALLLYAVWPRDGLRHPGCQARRRSRGPANVAWAITGDDGAVLDCNPVYRRMAGAREDESPAAARTGAGGRTVQRRALSPVARCRRRQSPRGKLPGDAGAGIRGRGAPACKTSRPPGGSRRACSASVSPSPILRSPRLWRRSRPNRLPRPWPCPKRASIRRRATLFRDAPMGVAFADANGVISEANAAFAKFFGLSGALTGQNVGATGRGERPQPGAGADRQRCGQGRKRSGRAAGIALSAKTAWPNCSPARWPAGAVLYLVDVSEQKALETKFAQSQKMQAVGQLAGGVAHDFNNLLTVIIGNCEFLLMRHQAGDPSFKEINEVHQNALRAATLVGQLLAFSRKQTMQPKVLALGDVIGELAQMLRRLLREGITLKSSNGPDLWPVHADEAQLSNAIINLVVNARDAMPGGGTVTIKTANETVHACQSRWAPPSCRRAIMCASKSADTGTGMSKEIQSKIFDPFFTTKPVGQGTGLGLATVYGIVKQSGGFITVDSEVGRGTSFKIYLPRQRSRGRRAAPPKPRRSPPRDVTGQDTILLVEDEEAVRSFAARALRMRGYQCAGSQRRRGSAGDRQKGDARRSIFSSPTW